MAGELDRMSVVLEAQTAPLRRGIEQVERRLSQFDSRFRRNMRQNERATTAFARGFQRLAVSVGAVAGASALAAFTQQSLAAAESIKDVADRVGFATERLQELRFAADQNGSSARTLDMALQRFSRRVAEAAQGSGELAGDLRRLNIPLRDANGQMRDSYDILRDYADAIQNAESEQERLRLAFKAFDSEGAQLVALMAQGSEGIDHFSARAREAGLVLEDGIVRQGAEANATLRAMRQEFQTGLNRAILENVDGIETLVSAIGNLVRGMLTAIGAAHRLGVEIRDLLNLDTPGLEEQAAGFATAAARMRANPNMTRGELRSLLNDQVGRDEARRFMQSVGLVNADGRTLGSRLPIDGPGATRSREQMIELLEGFGDGARRMKEIVDELEAVEVPDLVPRRGFPLEPITESEFVPMRGEPGSGQTVSGFRDRVGQLYEGGTNEPDESREQAKEQARVKVEAEKDEYVRNRDDFAREFASVATQGWMAAWDGNLADFAARKLRDALSNYLFSLFEQLGRQLFGGGGGVLDLVSLAAGKPGAGGIGKVKGRASGGPFSAGSLMRVGESGPELVATGSAGTVINAAAVRALARRPMGGAAAHISISMGGIQVDARGATQDAVEQMREVLPAAFEENNRRLLARMRSEVPGLVLRARQDGVLK
ncbi:hypothetical protein E5163_14920 [Marinicauda algicola]|uniref:Phage tail tape measure protein n=1 Tax=Marinicauda algicola TaxID=2029849 RepID=A0A4S2GWU8_9PROT|nr:hypothetical protein [Marinicauda algicola]TGY87358.1 hypothetical protein E5163_14920 [Marinicauda algicola]